MFIMMLEADGPADRISCIRSDDKIIRVGLGVVMGYNVLEYECPCYTTCWSSSAHGIQRVGLGVPMGYNVLE